MTVGEMLYKMTREELVEWMAFFQLEPWGSRIEDQRHGVIAATVANAMSSGGRRYTSTDFFPPKTEREKQLVVANKVLSAFSKFPSVDKRKQH